MEYRSLEPVDLVYLCAEKDSNAWEELIRRYRGSIALAILRVLRGWGEYAPGLLDDLVQETYLALCANEYRLLRKFVESNPQSLSALLRVVAANITHDQIRARRSRKRHAGYNALDADPSSTEDALSDAGVEKIEREIQLAEIDRVLRKAPKPISSRRDRSIFWMHFRLGLSAESISRIPSVDLTPKGVESSIYRALDFIRQTFQIRAS